MSNQIKYTKSFDWDRKSACDVNSDNSFSALTSMSSVPKSKCPPAKPPRRKLSYPNDNTKSCSSDEAFSIINTKSSLAKLNSNIYIDTLSKSSSSASSKGLSTSGTEGSDYGSLQGDHPLLRNSGKLSNHDKEKSRQNSMDSFYCSSTPKVPERRRNSIQITETWPSILSPSSVYYTPHGTPKSGWTTTEKIHDRFEENQKTFNLAEKILAQKSSSIHRRHNSDPQIALERRPSRRALRQRAADRRSHSFVGIPNAPFLGRSRLFRDQNQCIEGSSYHVLSEEVKMLRDMCDKLWDQLRQTQLKLDLLQNKTTNNQCSPSFSDLLSEVYYAQRDRDKAVQERLELSMTERRYLLTQVENLREVIFRRNMQKAETSDEDLDDQEESLGLEKVLKGLEICNSPSKLEEHRDRLLKRVKQVKDSQLSTLSQQLSKVTAQRDSALVKMQLLSEELQEFKWASSASSQSSSQAQSEKSRKRLEDLQEEFASLQLCYSLQASQQGNARSLDAESEDICFYALDKTDNTQDVDLLKALLKAEYMARTQKEEECKKLERLVNVLRKKLLGSSVGIPV